MNVAYKLVILFWLLLAGCTPSTLVEDYADDRVEKQAIEYIDLLIQNESATLISLLGPDTVEGNEEDVFAEMHALFPIEEPQVINLVGYRFWKHNKDPARYNLTYQYGYGDKWLIVNVAFQESETGKNEIFGFNVYPNEQSLQALNKFSLSNLNAIRAFFLAGSTVIPPFILFTLLACIRTKLKKKKWLWILFILIGIGRFSLNWTSGKFGITLFSLQVMGAGAVTASIYPNVS
jgi:hypothetical protein